MNLSGIRADVVGVGFIGVAHVEALRRLGVEVVGVVGSTAERARAKAEASGLPEVYDSAEALAADPGIDVIHVASPTTPTPTRSVSPSTPASTSCARSRWPSTPPTPPTWCSVPPSRVW
jgi:threonine dehydrogenase-like Zn-dependent dehydrogenase